MEEKDYSKMTAEELETNRNNVVRLLDNISRITKDSVQEIFDTHFGKGKVHVGNVYRDQVGFYLPDGPEHASVSVMEAGWPEDSDNPDEKPEIRMRFNETPYIATLSGDQEKDRAQPYNYSVAMLLTRLLTDTELRWRLTERLQAVFSVQRLLHKKLHVIKECMDSLKK